MTLTVGSLCTGYGGLDQAAELALGQPLTRAWHAETDPAAATVLAAHHPGVPNLGDITRTDWTRVPPVDILTGGWPCQPWSLAGKRKGKNDARAIWPAVADAIRDLRPAIVYLENVAAIAAAGELARAVASLASIGYVGSWRSVRASDIGAPHRRERIFILAWPADAHGDALRTAEVIQSRCGGTPVTGQALLPTPRVSDANGAGGHGDGGADLRTTVTTLPTPRARDWKRGGKDGIEEALLPTPRATDGSKGGPNQRGSSGDLMLPSAVQPHNLLPTPAAVDARGARNATSGRKAGSQHHDGWTLGDIAYADRWGQYAAAIARWEAVVGQPAPEPTEPNRRGDGVRLAAPFVELMMGLPAGWVTDHVGRNDALRLLGNGVVPQQGAHAWRQLAHLDRARTVTHA